MKNSKILAECYHINPKTVVKWKKHSLHENIGPKQQLRKKSYCIL